MKEFWYLLAFDQESNAGHGRYSIPLVGPFATFEETKPHVSPTFAELERRDPFNVFLKLVSVSFATDKGPGALNAKILDN